MMNLYYMGKYDLNPESIPAKPHKPNYVKFKEPEDPKKLRRIARIICIVLFPILIIPLIFKGAVVAFTAIWVGAVISLLVLFPHEIMHALCFKEDVYLFINLKYGMLFVSGPEDMSKARFIFMSLLPNIVLGFIPYLVFLINQDLL